jgi:hypothetical protein
LAGLEAPWELTGEGKEKGKERRGTRGAAWEGGGVARGAPWGEGAARGPWGRCPVATLSLFRATAS